MGTKKKRPPPPRNDAALIDRLRKVAPDVLTAKVDFDALIDALLKKEIGDHSTATVHAHSAIQVKKIASRSRARAQVPLVKRPIRTSPTESGGTLRYAG